MFPFLKPIIGKCLIYTNKRYLFHYSLEYVTPIIITLMNDLRCRITENKSTAVPTHRQAHGCQHENARLQSNLAGEQGKGFSHVLSVFF